VADYPASIRIRILDRRRTRDPKEFVAEADKAIEAADAAVAAPVIPKSLWRTVLEELSAIADGRRTRDPKEFVAVLQDLDLGGDARSPHPRSQRVCGGASKPTTR